MRTLLPMLLICVVALAVAALAQEKPPTTPAVASQDNPFSAWNKRTYGSVKKILVAYAKKMHEENYNFKPTDVVRSYGQIIGHIAESQYFFCSIALGEKNPAPGIEKTKTSKADLIGALKDAFAYCDKAYDGMTDATGAQIVSSWGPTHRNSAELSPPTFCTFAREFSAFTARGCSMGSVHHSTPSRDHRLPSHPRVGARDAHPGRRARALLTPRASCLCPAHSH